MRRLGPKRSGTDSHPFPCETGVDLPPKKPRILDLVIAFGDAFLPAGSYNPLFPRGMRAAMATLLQITKASKHYGDQVLLDEADATIGDNVKVGFIGRNGAGKSTLFRIILG